MNNSRRANIFLTLLLIISIILSTFVGYYILKDSKKVKADNFINKNVNEVYAWCSNLPSKYACEFIYEESREYNKGTVFYQSVNEGEKINNSIVFKVSSRLIENIELLDIDNHTTRVDVENWIKRNNITDYTFVDQEDSVVPNGIIIRVDPKDNIYQDTHLTIYVSSGTKKDDTISVKYGDYIGISVSDFESKVKKIGLNPVHLSSTDAYSSSIAKGNVVWHGTGDYVENENISYGISLGINDKQIEIKPDAYLGLSENDFKNKAKELELNAVHNENWDNYSDTIEKGKIVFHGSGTYVPNENFRYGLSLGKKSSSSDTSEIEILRTQFLNLSTEDFNTKTKALGLDPYHDSDVDDYSDTIEKGKVVWHGYGVYVKNERIRYGVSLGVNTNKEIVIKADTYVGITEEEFKNKAKELGLKPVHNDGWDNYSDTIETGKIVFHGYGTYVTNETFRYGLSLGKKSSGSDTNPIEILRTQFRDISPEEFETKTKALGLVPSHDTSVDDYSDTIEKGKVVWHGYGDFVKNEKIRYGLSLGKKDSGSSDSNSIKVTKGQYINISVSDFESKTKALGLDPHHDTSVDDYSDTIEKGKVVWHGSGEYVKGEKIRYGLSLGKKSSDDSTGSATIMRPQYYAHTCGDTFAATKENLGKTLAPFTNVKYIETTSKLGVGQIEKIVVNGSESYDSGSYPVNTPIEIYIVSKQSN